MAKQFGVPMIVLLRDVTLARWTFVIDGKKLYPAFRNFQGIRKHFDPHDAFGNHWTQSLFDSDRTAEKTLPSTSA